MLRSISATTVTVIAVIMLFLTTSPQGLEVNQSTDYEHSLDFLHAHQFWNELPIGMGNETIINQTGLLKIEAYSFFAENGSVNISIYDGDDLIFSLENSNKTMYREVFVTEGMAVQTLAEGSHSAFKTPIGDFYVVRFSLIY